MEDAPKIQDYALIGDTFSAALVSRHGAIDWLCWPRFDSPSLFGRLLGEGAGTFRISPTAGARFERAYVDGTNVLETRFTTETGTAVLTDLMPVATMETQERLSVPQRELLRRVECTRGGIELEVRFEPRPSWGRGPARLRDLGVLGMRLDLGRAVITLRTDAKLVLRADGSASLKLWLRAGDARHFSLTYHDEAPVVLPPLGAFTLDRIHQSVHAWRRWSARAEYNGPFRPHVIRSALVLKLLAYSPSGAIVAAPTTSLPERVGSDLNWDYRYCWIRDAALTARALFSLGYSDEAESFVGWLIHTTRLSRPRVDVLYDLYGRKPPHERDLTHLDGYRGSKPVRVGNAAARQEQLDTYGELIDAAAQMARRRRKLDGETQRMLRQLGDYVCRHWDEPDAGLWEERGDLEPHTHSRLLAWVALERLRELHDKGLLKRLRRAKVDKVLASLREQIETRGYSSEAASYTQTLGGTELDASTLLISWYGFENASASRMVTTGRRIREVLGAGPGLLYRYEKSKTVGEGAFGICSFWLVEHLARGGGSLEEAREVFDAMVHRANDVGLFAEEIDPASGDALGNFPQGFTHIGLINAALSLFEREQREQRERQSPRREPGAAPGAATSHAGTQP